MLAMMGEGLLRISRNAATPLKRASFSGRGARHLAGTMCPAAACRWYPRLKVSSFWHNCTLVYRADSMPHLQRATRSVEFAHPGGSAAAGHCSMSMLLEKQ